MQYSIVDLTPKTAQSYYRIRVYIVKTSQKIAKIAVYEKDEESYITCNGSCTYIHTFGLWRYIKGCN